MSVLRTSRILGAFLLGLFAVAAPLQATPVSASGDFSFLAFQPTSVEQRGTTTHMTTEDVLLLTGDLEGILNGSFQVTITEDGSGVFHGFSVFEGTYKGRTGTFYFSENGRISNSVFLEGNFAVVDAEGELAGIHGHGTINGILGVGGTYTMRVIE